MPAAPDAARVDAHHHLWDVRKRPQPWMDGPWADPLRRAFTPADLAPLLTAAGIGASVVVQTVADLDETRELLALTAATPWLAGVVGWADLTDPALPETLAELRAAPGGHALVGIRHQVHDEPDPGWLNRADVRRGLHAVADAGLCYDLLVRPRELPAALAAVTALPELTFVLDHLAKPPIADRVLEPWSTLLTDLAARHNVACKLSGMVTEADWTSWHTDQLWPYAARVIDAFGPRRLLFGSDWPVCTLAASYQQVNALADDLLSRAGIAPGTAEHAEVRGGTALRTYRLVPCAR
jgi:L-fuconolactonase